jgi:hypothetical protein
MKFSIILALTLIVIFAGSCGIVKHEMPSICTAASEDDMNNPFYQTVILAAALPKGATVTGSIIPKGETVIDYKGTKYTFTMRRDGTNICLDFHPPIPID